MIFLFFNVFLAKLRIKSPESLIKAFKEHKIDPFDIPYELASFGQINYEIEEELTLLMP